MADASLAERNRSGIYQIRNTVNGKRYIGSARKFRARWAKHLCDLRRGDHHSLALQRAWNKYGEGCFSFEVILTCESSSLIEHEQAILDELSPEYNICAVAGSTAGRFLSTETREKISKALLGRQVSELTRSRMSAAWKHRPPMPPVSDTTRAKQSAARKGVANPRTPDHTAKIGLAKRKFSDAQLIEMLALVSVGKRQREIAAQYGCSEAYVSRLVSGSLSRKASLI